MLVPLAVRGAAGALRKFTCRTPGCSLLDDIRADKGVVPGTPHERRRTMPHILTTILTQVAVALLEAAAVRLAVQFWKVFGTGGHPAAAHA
ncbi:hypothetical protein ACR6C2_13150 [Streptomyces sp. INA 01156]